MMYHPANPIVCHNLTYKIELIRSSRANFGCGYLISLIWISDILYWNQLYSDPILTLIKIKWIYMLRAFSKINSTFRFSIFNFLYESKQDGPSLESSSYLNVSLRYLGPWDPLTLEPLDLGTLGTLPSSNTSSYFPLHPLTSSYLFLLPSSFGMVWLWVVRLENEIGYGPLTPGPPPSFYILFL